MTETKTENRHKKNRTWTDEEKETHKEAVSYTHLTLPTNTTV